MWRVRFERDPEIGDGAQSRTDLLLLGNVGAARTQPESGFSASPSKAASGVAVVANDFESLQLDLLPAEVGDVQLVGEMRFVAAREGHGRDGNFEIDRDRSDVGGELGPINILVAMRRRKCMIAGYAYSDTQGGDWIHFRGASGWEDSRPRWSRASISARRR